MITWHVEGNYAGKAFATYGAIYNRYRNLSDTPWKVIGLPISDEDEAAQSSIMNE